MSIKFHELIPFSSPPFCFQDVVSEAHKACLGDKKADKKSVKRSQHLPRLCCLLRMANIWLTHNKGGIVSDPSAVAKVCGVDCVAVHGIYIYICGC